MSAYSYPTVAAASSGGVLQSISRTVTFADLAALANGVKTQAFAFADAFPADAVFFAPIISPSGYAVFLATGDPAITVSAGAMGSADAIATAEQIGAGQGGAPGGMTPGEAGAQLTTDIAGLTPSITLSSAADLNTFASGSVTVELTYLTFT